jgi:hypothetical protein
MLDLPSISRANETEFVHIRSHSGEYSNVDEQKHDGQPADIIFLVDDRF